MNDFQCLVRLRLEAGNDLLHQDRLFVINEAVIKNETIPLHNRPQEVWTLLSLVQDAPREDLTRVHVGKLNHLLGTFFSLQGISNDLCFRLLHHDIFLGVVNKRLQRQKRMKLLIELVSRFFDEDKATDDLECLAECLSLLWLQGAFSQLEQERLSVADVSPAGLRDVRTQKLGNSVSLSSAESTDVGKDKLGETVFHLRLHLAKAVLVPAHLHQRVEKHRQVNGRQVSKRLLVGQEKSQKRLNEHRGDIIGQLFAEVEVDQILTGHLLRFLESLK